MRVALERRAGKCVPGWLGDDLVVFGARGDRRRPKAGGKTRRIVTGEETNRPR